MVFLEGAAGIPTLGDAQKADLVEGREVVRVKDQGEKDDLKNKKGEVEMISTPWMVVRIRIMMVALAFSWLPLLPASLASQPGPCSALL